MCIFIYLSWFYAVSMFMPQPSTTVKSLAEDTSYYLLFSWKQILNLVAKVNAEEASR